MCNERDSICSIPAMCEDPANTTDWGATRLTIMQDYPPDGLGGIIHPLSMYVLLVFQLKERS